jgi:hypothetical protein
VDCDPRQWATITVPGFGTDRPQAYRAYQDFMQRARGFGVRVVSYDP